jgi:hypothetical protein
MTGKRERERLVSSRKTASSEGDEVDGHRNRRRQARSPKRLLGFNESKSRRLWFVAPDQVSIPDTLFEALVVQKQPVSECRNRGTRQRMLNQSIEIVVSRKARGWRAQKDGWPARQREDVEEGEAKG